MQSMSLQTTITFMSNYELRLNPSTGGELSSNEQAASTDDCKVGGERRHTRQWRGSEADRRWHDEMVEKRQSRQADTVEMR